MPLTEGPQATDGIEIPEKWSFCTIRGLNAGRDFGVALALQFGATTEMPEPGTYHISGVNDPERFANFLRDCKEKQPNAEIIFDETVDETDWQVLKRECGSVLSRLRGTLRSRS